MALALTLHSAAGALSARPPHMKARGPHPLYPPRAPVPDERCAWRTPWLEYSPQSYTADKVIANDCTTNPNGWADPPYLPERERSDRCSFEGALQWDGDGRPLNPRGRTGMAERGLLGKWGANFAADPIVTRWRPDDASQLQVVVIERSDTGEWALPGGMVDAGETVSAAVRREFEEEAGALTDAAAQATYGELTDELFSSGVTIYQGYVDDPRNTDHAWMETTAFHFHCSEALGERLPLNAGDDAKAVRWVDVG
eukprot:1833070-Prymnesium_polylepis.1